MTNSASFTSNELVAIFGEINCHFYNDFESNSVETDTRSMKPNSLFIAIKGEQHDSHNFIGKAMENGAACIIVEQSWFEQNQNEFKDVNFISVKNTTKALGKLANFHRTRFDIDVVAVAGSNGKTTTKELTSLVLSSEKKVLRTYKNFNNQIGVPLMLLQMDDTNDIAVIEIGTNEPGEIFLLSEILAPTAGVITNIGKEHLEGFIDLDGVESEETSLFAYLKKSDSVAFLNMDDERLAKYLSLFDNVFTYGQNTNNEYNLNAKIEINKDLTSKLTLNNQVETFEVNLKAKGLNFAYNAIPAVAIGLFYKIPIEKIIKSLESYEPETGQSYGRMVVLQKDGITILNDTYNANPSSAALALETLSLTQSDNKIAVLGDMLELGDCSIDEHKEILKKAKSIANSILVYGNNFKQSLALISDTSNINHFENKEELINYLQKILISNTSVLVKGSRGMQMEQVVEQILK